MKKEKTSGPNNPTVHLAINKGRVKKYGKNKSIPSYYLENKQEFQIELYNPTQGNILTTIKLNDNPISGGLIIRAGERIFLDRYLDSNKKFLFDTYEVENKKSAQKAIELNGDIEVAFFKENVPLEPLSSNTMWDGNMRCSSGSGIDNNYSNSITTLSNSTVLYDNLSFTTTNYSAPIETGRVEKGSESDQILVSSDKDFDIVSFHVVKYKLLPKSQKKITSKEYYTKYCPNCGSKTKTKFCSSCGEKQ